MRIARSFICALALAAACSPSSPSPSTSAEPPKPPGPKTMSAAMLAELRTPEAWVPTQFLDGALTVSLPPMLQKKPPPKVPGTEIDRSGIVSMRNEDDTFGFVLNRGGHLQEKSVSEICFSMSAEDMGATGGRIVARELLNTHATPICKLHSVTSSYLTMQRLISIEGHGTHVAVTLAETEDEATKLAAEKILATIQIKPTAEGSPCAADAAPKCADDRRLMVCKDGHWLAVYCNAACESQGGAGEGCFWDREKNEPTCVCGKP